MFFTRLAYICVVVICMDKGNFNINVLAFVNTFTFIL